MESILRWLTARTFLTLGAALAAVWMADHFQAFPRLFFENFRLSSERGPRTLPEDLLRDLETRESLQLISLHRVVVAELSAAKTKGFDVSNLQVAADSALSLNVPKYRAAAMERLNKLRLAIPQERTKVRPASAEDEPSDAPRAPHPTTRRVKRKI